MTVITFRKSDLERLLGTELSETELRQVLTRLKGEVERVEGDEVEMEITHDRPDLFSVEGLARALKGLLGIEVGAPRLNVRKDAYELRVENVPHRKYIVTCIVRDVELDDEAVRQLMQLQEKLHQTYGRDRRYFAIGLYDADKIRFPITYKLVKASEVRYVPLGYDHQMSGEEVLEKTEKGTRYRNLALYEGHVPVIVDAEDNILVIIPVLNSELHKVTPDTKNIMIDVTATDLRYALDAMRVLVYNIAERSRSKVVEIPHIRADYGETVRQRLLEFRMFKLELSEIEELSGLRMSVDEAVKYLLMARHDAYPEDGNIVVKVPPFRINVLHSVDLVEDILVSYGYDRITPEYPSQPVQGRLSTRTRLVDYLRSALIGMSFQEVMTYIMTSSSLLRTCQQDRGIIEVLNPKSELYNCVRTSLWPVLLEAAMRNEARISEQLRLFDFGEVAYVEDGGVVQDFRLCLLVTGRKVTLTDGLVMLKTLGKLLGLEFRYEKTTVTGLIPERTAKIVVGDVEVGYVGEVSPEVLSKLGFYYPTVVAELSIDKLLQVL